MNKLQYLGFLGFLGLLGIATDNPGFFGFFGFFSFFAAMQNSDERLSKNAYKAGFHSFVVGLVGLSVIITALAIGVPKDVLAAIVAAAFICAIITFVWVLARLEKKGERS